MVTGRRNIIVRVSLGLSMLVRRMRCAMENSNGGCFIRVKLLILPKIKGEVKFLVFCQETILITFRHERAKR